MKSIKKLHIVLLIIIFFYVANLIPYNATQAKSKDIKELTEAKALTVGNVTVSIIAEKEKYLYGIKIKVNRNTKETIKNVGGLAFTDGKNLYYTVYTDKKATVNGEETTTNVIYKLNTKTLKKTKLLSGGGYELQNLELPYMYYGRILGAGEGAVYCRNINTKKTVKLYNYGLCMVSVGDKRVCISPHGGDVGNSAMYAYNFNGTGKTYVGDGLFATNIKNYFYYVEYKYIEGSSYFRVVRTDIKGKNKKYLTKYVKNAVDCSRIEENSLKFIEKTIKK